MGIITTARLKLKKPDNDEYASPLDLNANMDILDKTPGLVPVTSETRPAVPFVGQRIIEQDKKRIWRWEGTEWRPVWPKPICWAYNSADFNYNAAGTWMSYPLNATRFDPWEIFDKVGNRFVVPWTGLWHLDVACMSPTNTNAWLGAVGLAHSVYGTVWAQFNTKLYNTWGQTAGPLDIVAHLNKGEVVTMYVYFDTAPQLLTQQVGNKGHATYFQAQYLGG